MAKKKASSKKTTAKKTENAVVKSVQKTEATVKAIRAKGGKSFPKTLINKLMQPKALAAITAEFIGTFILASTVIVLTTYGNYITLLGNILLSGLALAFIVLIIGKASGAHVNPLITAGSWATRRIGHCRALSYIIAQILGAMLAFVLIGYFFSQSGQNLPAAVQKIPEGKEFSILLDEFIGSMIFAFSVAQVTSQKQHNSTAVALGVGGGLMLALIIAGFATTVTQASSIFNPAIAIAVQAFTVEGTNTLWAIATYLGGALLGGITGFGFSLLLQNNSEK